MSGILLLRKGRTVVGRLLLLSLCVPPAVLLADTAASGEWFAAGHSARAATPWQRPERALPGRIGRAVRV